MDIIKGKKAIDEYRKVYRETKTCPLEKLKLDLKDAGFNSFEEFEKADREYLRGPFVDEYIASLKNRQFRLLLSSGNNPKYEQATYEAITKSIQNGTSENTIISWCPEVFSLGIPKNSKIEVINKDKVELLGIKYVRSLFSSGDIGFISSGTPIMNILDKSIYDNKMGEEITKRILQRTFSLLGLETKIKGNDLIFQNKKIGATANFKIENVNNLALGALLDLDLDLIDNIIFMKESRSGRLGMLPSERVITFKSALGREVTYDEYEQAFLIAVSEILKISVVKKGLTKKERILVNQLMPKYESEQWTLNGEYDGN